jgi:hypothetical protein
MGGDLGGGGVALVFISAPTTATRLRVTSSHGTRLHAAAVGTKVHHAKSYDFI